MVEKTKSGKNGSSIPDQENGPTEPSPDVGGLTASLDALKKIATKGEERNQKKAENQSSTKDKADDHTAGSVKNLVDELDEKYSTVEENHGNKVARKAKANKSEKNKSDKKPKRPKKSKQSKDLGVVDLLGALKSDIESLRHENEAFKAELMSRPAVQTNGVEGQNDVRMLLEALKADIGNLRNESDLLRSQAIADQQGETSLVEAQAGDGDSELYSMLAELKDDIVSLRSENEALVRGAAVAPAARPAKKSDEVARMLQELKSDINVLKHENESLRLENLTARDGAHFENLGGQRDAYRNNDDSVLPVFMKGAAAFVLFAAAAGGGYYLAKSQGDPGGSANIASTTASPARDLKPVQPSIIANRAIPPAASVKAPEIGKAASVSKADGRPSTISSEVETAMMSRADGLIAARDLGAARMVFVYLARHGSASAMNRLAQTYDPQYLSRQQFDEVKNGDLTRAIRLYGAASVMGDASASARLKDVQ